MRSLISTFQSVAARLVGPLVAVLISALLGSCGAPREVKQPSFKMPASTGRSVNVQGALIVATPLMDPQRAQEAFGFDIRGAGLLPVRLTLDNRSKATLDIRPEQTFLIDKEGQAWPMLTQSQAYNRINRALEQGEIAVDQSGTSKILQSAVSSLGFALGMLLGRDVAGRPMRCFSVGAGLAQDDSCYIIENELRKDLASKGLKNQRILPGDLAYGVLFFPGREEAKYPRNLRLSLELDSYPEIVTVPLE
jgi:hypothetical protein